MFKTRDYVDTVLEAAKSAGWFPFSILNSPILFELIVADVDTRLAKQRDVDHNIIVKVDGGCVDGVENIPAGCCVIVRDYDTDGASDEYLVTDDGDEYVQHCFWPDGSMMPGLATAPDAVLNYYSHCNTEWSSPAPKRITDSCHTCNAVIEPDKSVAIPHFTPDSECGNCHTPINQKVLSHLGLCPDCTGKWINREI